MKKKDFISRFIDQHIFDRFFKNTFYIQFKSDWVSVLRVETGEIIEDIPLVALEKNSIGQDIVMAVGKGCNQAKSTWGNGLRILNGFDHPSMCIGNFDLAAAVFRHLISRIMNGGIFVRPILVLHPLEKVENGLTDLDNRLLLELGESVGGRQIYVWTGRKLTQDELLNLSFLSNQP